MRPREYVAPTSVEEARERLSALTTDMLSIQNQLGERKGDDPDTVGWRTRAKAALNHVNAQRSLLKDYIRSNASDLITLTTGEVARVMTARVNRLERVAAIACAFVDDDSDEAFAALEEAVNDFRKDVPIGGAA